MESTTTITALQIINLSRDVASLNATYLGICVTVILFSGGITAGFYYYFNFKPLQKSIKDHEDKLELLRIKIEKEAKEHEESLKNIELKAAEEILILGEKTKKEYLDLGARLEMEVDTMKSSIETELTNLKKRQKEFELDVLINEFFLWKVADIPDNQLVSLINYLEKYIEYKIGHSTHFVLEQIVKIISKPNFFAEADKERLEIKQKLTVLISKITGFEKEKSKIANLL
jgi:hypothetical protein